MYSNTNYFLLGLVVQRATHKTLAEFAAENIFQPLGMTHTLSYDNNKLVLPDRVAAYARDFRLPASSQVYTIISRN